MTRTISMRAYFTTFLCVLLTAINAGAQTPAVVESRILAALKTISETGTYSGDYSDDDGARNSAANKRLSDLLIKQGTRPEILRYTFPKLKDKMSIATSKDGKLRIYSWDTETGGTMHDYSSIVEYQGASGKVYTWADITQSDDEPEDGSAESYGIGSGGYYMRIFQVDAKDGPIYLANALSVGCGQCHGQSLEAARIDGETLEREAKVIKTSSGLTNTIDFAYAPASLPARLTTNDLVKFDPKANTFSIPVVIEDDENPLGKVTTRRITYRFNGTHFVKVS